MRAVAGRERYLVMAQTGKRSLVGWAAAEWVPSNALNVFALSDDYHFAVLSSRTHVSWGLQCGSTLENRPRYTPTSSFETFPWPQTDDATRTKLARLGAQLHGARVDATRRAGGLTKVYNQMDEGGWEDLRKIHRKIDLAVVAAYGWDTAVADDDRARNQALYDLNADITAGRRTYIAF